MASDDMLVILYKILRYLDQCSKAGKSPRYEDMCYKSRLFNIQESRWTQVMEEAVRVFPAYAGVILEPPPETDPHPRVPRVCGGDPIIKIQSRKTLVSTAASARKETKWKKE